jgi:hypothetical protein
VYWTLDKEKKVQIDLLKSKTVNGMSSGGLDPCVDADVVVTKSVIFKSGENNEHGEQNKRTAGERSLGGV